MKGLGIILSALAALVPPVAAETVTLWAERDAALIEDVDGALANGAGPGFRVGRTAQNQGSIRRGLVYFDVAGALPRNAIIESAALTLVMTSGNLQPVEIRLHRVLQAWSEGPSVSLGGGGADAEPGDATWIHTSHDDESWRREGGQFVARTTAAIVVTDPAFYTWESNNHLVQDVRLWRSNPGHNHGWILIGDESTRQNVKVFGSREIAVVDLRPKLTIRYRLPGRHDR